MALQVWLPLNGNMNNEGVSALTFSANSPSWNTASTKFGKNLSLKATNVAFTASGMTGATKFSIAFWIYASSNSSYSRDWNAAIYFGDGSSNLRFESTYGSSLRALSFHNNTGYKITTASVILAPDKDKWYHVAVTCDGSKIYSYRNGQLISTDNAAGGALNGVIYINQQTYYGYMSDLRVYDEVLSTKEIKEISLGMILHYPLNDSYCTSSINKYGGANFDGKPSSGGGYTVTPLTDERGYNLKLSYTGTGTNNWFSFSYPYFSFTAGKTYDYSCKVRCHSSNFSIALRASRMGNDWEANAVNVTNADGKWHEYHRRVTLQAKSTRSGTEYTTNPLLEFYSQALTTKDTKFSCDFDIKDVQVSECGVDSASSNGAWNDKVVYDTSGWGNNGSVVDASIPTLSDGSPRYDKCYEILSKHYITGKDPFNGNAAENATISVWINQIEGGGYSTYFSGSGYGGSGWWLAINCEDTAQWMYRGGVSPNYCKGGSKVAVNTWHMYTITFDNGVATWYLDGVKNCAATYTTKTISMGGSFTLGDSFTGNTWNTSFHGKLSDLRIYAIPLSAADVLDLYRNSISITNTGAMIVKGEVIEV